MNDEELKSKDKKQLIGIIRGLERESLEHKLSISLLQKTLESLSGGANVSDLLGDFCTRVGRLEARAIQLKSALAQGSLAVNRLQDHKAARQADHTRGIEELKENLRKALAKTKIVRPATDAPRPATGLGPLVETAAERDTLKRENAGLLRENVRLAAQLRAAAGLSPQTLNIRNPLPTTERYEASSLSFSRLLASEPGEDSRKLEAAMINNSKLVAIVWTVLAAHLRLLARPLESRPSRTPRAKSLDPTAKPPSISPQSFKRKTALAYLNHLQETLDERIEKIFNKLIFGAKYKEPAPLREELFLKRSASLNIT